MFKKTSRKGQSMVELALTMPLLILIVAGILDLGRAYFTFIAMSDAAAEGAAIAAIHPADTAQAVARATDGSNGLVVFEPDMVSVEYGELSPGNPITVTIEYEYELLTPIIRELFPDGTLTMKATVTQVIIGDGF